MWPINTVHSTVLILTLYTLELKTCTPVIPALRNIYNSVGFCMPYCSQAMSKAKRLMETETDGQEL